MQKRQLGQHGPEVSAIGLGCMSFSGFFGPTDEATSLECLDAAYEYGIDFLDTANVYGMGLSESIIGTWLKSRKPDVKIATKAGIFREPTRHFGNSEAALRTEMDASFQRLGVDYVDLYYIHRREQERPIEEVVQTLCKFQAEGKIGQFGFSEIAPSSLRRASAIAPVAAVQNEYSLWSRQPDLGLRQACAEVGSTLVAFSPLARGVFGQGYPDPAQMNESDLRRSMPRFVAPNYQANIKIIDGFKAFAADHGWTVSALALAWVLDQAPHIIPIPGTRTTAHLMEWINAGDIRLTGAQRAEIETLLPVGFAHGDRYSDSQIIGVERYC